MINPRSPFPTRLLLFLRPWSLEILEPATKPYLLSPRYKGVLIVMAGPLLQLPSLLLSSFIVAGAVVLLFLLPLTQYR